MTDPAWMVQSDALATESYAANLEARNLTSMSVFADPSQADGWLEEARRYRVAAAVLLDEALALIPQRWGAQP